MAQNEPTQTADHYGYDDGDGKSKFTGFHTIDEVHTKEAGDERRKHHDDADRSERTHHGVHVVVDNAGIGVHRRLQNVGVDIGRFSCLGHLDVDIFDEVGVEFVYLKFEFQFL